MLIGLGILRGNSLSSLSVRTRIWKGKIAHKEKRGSLNFISTNFAPFAGGGKQKISKEALDKQLDDYMAKGSA